MSELNSCIYRGTIRHRRRSPVGNAFKFSAYMMYVDLEELETLFDGRLLWSARRPAAARFRREDHLKEHSVELPLREAVVAELRQHGVEAPIGPIRLLTQFRHFGFEMNPVSFYYCFSPDESRVEVILAEVNNTPWGEQHVYVVPAEAGDPEVATDFQRKQKRVVADRIRKSFHVSPFMPMEMEYRMLFTIPDQQLGVKMQNFRGQERVFDVSMLMQRVPITAWSLNWIVFRYPLMTVQVFAGIYWQAMKLYFKGATFYRHSKPKEISEADAAIAGHSPADPASPT